jgi:hypothetical protein
MLKIVNMIPNNWSDEENQDCEPNLSVNPANPSEIIGTAFTFDNPAGTSAVSPAMTGNWAPLFSSVDGGNTWTLQFVLPSAAGDQLPTWDVTSRYGGNSGEVYSGLISPGGFTISIGRAPNAATQQTTMTTVTGDQPFLEATTEVAGGVSHDRLYVGYNANSSNSTVNVFLDATAALPTTTANSLDVRFPNDMPPTRTAIHRSGTIYCAFYSYHSLSPTSLRDVVIVKDLDWGGSTPAFTDLVDTGDGKVGVRIASSINNPWYNSNFLDSSFGNDRYGPELAIAVDPNDVQRVYIAYATGTTASDEALHLRWSNNGGQDWSADVRSIPTAKNPSIAINAFGMVGFVYQQVVGANWMTVLEVSDDGFVSSFSSHTLASTPTSDPTPASVMATYLGDYIKLQSIGVNFYGIFSASNAPAKANFPSGVTYQRNVNWATQTLLGNDGVTPVAVSIDPFFFKLTLEIPVVATSIANSGFFGDVCLNSFTDEMLTINNSGSGMLKIFKITTNSADFEVPSVIFYPLKVDAGDSIDLMIRFRPTSHGFKTGKITIVSNDPASPHVVDVSGECPAPHLALMIADHGNFGKCCVGSFVDEYLILNNNGKCWLSVTGIGSSLPDFLAPEVIAYPLTIGRGDSLQVPIRFAPTSHGHSSAMITVTSNDPAGQRTIEVSGDAPSGKLIITGSSCFGGVKACCCADRTISICNVGDCDLHVTSVRFKRKSHHWKLLRNPFPATLHAGSFLDVVIQYKATEKCPRSCELIIDSDDPSTPVKAIEVLAYTVWDTCGCKDCCEDCRKGSCEKGHNDRCCLQGYPCCCDDDNDDEDQEEC